MSDKFYANDANVGFEEYDTLAEAKSAAEEMLQIARDACDPEWPDWATSIEYGRLIPLATATETNVREADPEEDDPEGTEYFCDVELVSQPDELAQLRARLAQIEQAARDVCRAITQYSTNEVEGDTGCWEITAFPYVRVANIEDELEALKSALDPEAKESTKP